MTDLKVDEAKERVGRQMFGDAWVANMPKNEWDLAQEYKGGLTRDLAAEEAHAKLKRCERQGGEVGEWFENRGFNTTKEYLDRTRFEAVFKKVFRRPSTDHEMSPRDRAVLLRLQSGAQPGENVTWPVFQKWIRGDLGDPFAEGTSVKQLGRVVDQLKQAHQLD
jgi:hypothetical protein